MKVMKIKKKRVTLNLDEEVVKKIDIKRDGISRSYYINRILKNMLLIKIKKEFL